MTNHSDLPIQTLRLNDRDKAKLLWAIDQSNRKNEQSSDPTYNPRGLRVSCTKNDAILTLKSDGGGEARLSVLARNLGRWGIAMVHGRYVHPNSRCVVTLESKTSLEHDVLGTVRHIRHVQGTIHELGVEFDEPIDLSEFVDLSQSEETQYMRELADEMPESDDNDVSQLASRVLVVDDFSCDRKLFSHWLTQAGLLVTTCADPRSTHVQVQEQVFDLLMIDLNLGEEKGADLIRDLRENQIIAPIIAVSADETPEVHTQIQAAGSNDFLKKPFKKKQLIDKAFALLGVDAANDLTPIFSTHKSDPEMRPLLTEFTRKLKSYIEELREANAQTNFEAIGKLSKQLRGAGEGYGFPQISELAGTLIETMDQEDAELNAIRQVTNELISMLNRVKLT